MFTTIPGPRGLIAVEAAVRRGLCVGPVVCLLVACSSNDSQGSDSTQLHAGTSAAESGTSGAASATDADAGRAAGPARAGAGASAATAGAGTQVAGRAAAPASGAAASGAGAAPASAGSGGVPPDAPAAGAASKPDPASGAPQAGGNGAAPATACTREFLAGAIDRYFAALAAHDPGQLALADGVKFTENGELSKLGEGLWAKAGMVKFKESLLDVDECGTLTQAVVPEANTDLPFALRLSFEAQKITEIETIAVRPGDYLVESNPAAMIALMSKAWGDLVPQAERQTRAELGGWIDKYFRMFPMGGCNLAADCRRMENGFSLACSVGATCSNQAPTGRAVMMPRSILVDVEAGLAAGFTMFQGRYVDVHMIKYAAGEVHGVHTILAEAESSGWD